jgi:hypothetical protein
MAAFLSACGGFLLAVLWMDLMFDVQTLRYARTDEELPERVLASIAHYYQRVTTGASPMNLLIGAVMLATVAGTMAQFLMGRDPRWIAGASMALAGVPIVLARLRVIRNAVRLGARIDPLTGQTELARAICRDHLLCVVAIALFIGLQLSAAVR